MKFTIERKALVRMVEQMREKLHGRNQSDAVVKLSACAARVFVAACEPEPERNAGAESKKNAGDAPEFSFFEGIETKQPEQAERAKPVVLAAGYDALVLEDGECVVPREVFLRVLRSYERKKNLTVEADETGLRIGSFSMSVSSYSPTATPPGHFHVFPVTDLGVAGPVEPIAGNRSLR